MKLIIVENYEEASIEAAKVMLASMLKTIQLLIWDWLRDLHQSECMN